MLADAPPADLLTYLLLGSAVVFALLKGMERFGWLRTPTQWKTECEALQRECDRLNTRIETLETDVNALRAENADLRSRPDYDALVATVDKLAQVVQSAVTNEERIREHAHSLASIGNAANLKLDALLQHAGIPQS